MDSTALPWINLLIGSGELVGICIVIFRIGKLMQKIDGMNDKIDSFNSRINSKSSFVTTTLKS